MIYRVTASVSGFISWGHGYVSIHNNESKRVKNELMPLNPEQAWEMFEKELNKAEHELCHSWVYKKF